MIIAISGAYINGKLYLNDRWQLQLKPFISIGYDDRFAPFVGADFLSITRSVRTRPWLSCEN